MLVGSKVVLVLFVALATAVAGYSCALLARAIGVRSRLALAIAVIGYHPLPSFSTSSEPATRTISSVTRCCRFCACN
jgi:hypothetical protein